MIIYQEEHGSLHLDDSILWLRSLPDAWVDLVIADPPYNIGKAAWDVFADSEEYLRWCLEWIAQVGRVLKRHGSMYVFGFSEILADLRRPAMEYFEDCHWLVWSYKNKANLGNDWGRSHESILHFRKQRNTPIAIDAIRIPYQPHTTTYPHHPQGSSSAYRSSQSWTPNHRGAKPRDVLEVPIICNGMREKTPHPTQKPEELIRTLILASTQEHAIVLDPFSGSGTTVVCAEQLRRHWHGCDVNADYHTFAINRLQQITCKDPNTWIAHDYANKKRRMR